MSQLGTESPCVNWLAGYNRILARCKVPDGNIPAIVIAMPMRLALYEPDIPQNAGAMMRLASCLDVAVDIIEPCGFVLDDRRLRRAGMDYLDSVALSLHTSWRAFAKSREDAPGRLLLLTTRGEVRYTEFAFSPDDTLMVGRESGGVPTAVHQAVDARLVIPMAAGRRSLNVAVAAAMALGEALRQTDRFSGDTG